MPVIHPIPIEDLDQEKLGSRLKLAQQLMVPDIAFFQIMAHAPGYAEALFDAMYQSHAVGNVDHLLKEIIRILLARIAKDTYFASMRSAKAIQLGLDEARIDAACGNFEFDPQFNDAEKWALQYAKQMYVEPKRIDSKFYDLGKTFYSEAEIMELGAFIAFHYGMQMFFRTLKILPTTNIEK